MFTTLDSKAAIWDGKKFELRETKFYYPRTSTIVKVVGAGFCGTDKHLMEKPTLSQGKSLGHEIFGELVQIGSTVKSLGNQKLNVGDRVIVTPGIPCNACDICLSYGNHDNLCNHRRAHGFSVYNNKAYFPIGGFSNYIELLDDLWVIRVPDSLSTEQAMFAEPLAIAVKTIEMGLSGTRCDRDFGPGVAMRAAIVGLGPIGCSVAFVLKYLGAEIVGFDTDAEKAKKVSQLMGIKTCSVPDDSALAHTHIQSLNIEKEFDLVIEAAGYPKALELSLLLARKGGKIVEVGNFVPGHISHIDPALICKKELEIVGAALAPVYTYSKVFRLLEKYRDINLDALVTHRIPLSDINAMLNVIESNHYLKIHIDTEQ